MNHSTDGYSARHISIMSGTPPLAFRVETYFQDLQAIAKFGRICVVPGPAPDNFKESLHALDVDQFLAYCHQGVAIQFDAKLIQELRTHLMSWGAQFAARS